MPNMSWVTQWEAWRKSLGPAGSLQRRHVLEFLQTHPAVLYWGDSWFSTPLYLNLARQSARRIDGMNMIVGKPGALANALFSASEVERMGDRIANNPFDLVCLSAGGNDCLSERLAEVFADWQGASPRRRDRIDADAAWQVFLDSGLLDGVHAAYARVLVRLREVQRQRPSLRVLGQPYVPIEMIGMPADLSVANVGLIALLKGDAGPWLWGPMQHVLTDKQEGKAFARRMLVDGFRDRVLARLAHDHAGLFSVVDYGPAPTAPGFWNDEIHPTEAGFDTLAVSFNTALRGLLPAAKRAAVMAH